jgi:cephalosporin hydroxylase
MNVELTELDRYQAIKGVVNDYVWEFHEIIHDAQRSGPLENVLEIGCFQGDSLRVWREAFGPSLLMGIEVEDSERTREGLDPLIAEGVKLIFGSSQDPDVWGQVKSYLNGCVCEDPHRPIDFLYVDGNHLYDAARRDFFIYAPLVRPGGLIVMDDAVCMNNTSVEVWRLVPELSALYRTKLISGPNEVINNETITGGRLVCYAK